MENVWIYLIYLRKKRVLLTMNLLKLNNLLYVVWSYCFEGDIICCSLAFWYIIFYLLCFNSNNMFCVDAWMYYRQTWIYTNFYYDIVYLSYRIYEYITMYVTGSNFLTQIISWLLLLYFYIFSTVFYHIIRQALTNEVIMANLMAQFMKEVFFELWLNIIWFAN